MEMVVKARAGVGTYKQGGPIITCGESQPILEGTLYRSMFNHF